MPADLTGNKIQDIYSSFLHLSSTNLTTNLESVFDGNGNEAPIKVSTESILLNNKVSLSGTVTINDNTYPSQIGQVNNLLSVGVTPGVLSFRTLSDVLTSSVSSFIQNGTYSSPVITYHGGLPIQVFNNPSIKSFFVRDIALDNSKAITTIQTDWPFPVEGDIARVLNLHDSKAYNYKYNSTTGWVVVNSI